MNIVWFFIGMAVIGGLWALGDALYSRGRRSLVDEALLQRYCRAIGQGLGVEEAQLALAGGLRRAVRPHWNLLRRAALAGDEAEPLVHLRPVTEAIVERLPASARTLWRQHAALLQDAFIRQAYFEAISLGMVEAGAIR